MKNALALISLSLVSTTSFAATLNAHAGPANNGGSAGWAMFFDLTATGTDVLVTSLTTASTAAAGANFGIEVYTYAGSSLGGPVASGPGSSSAGWTHLGTAAATQGATASGVSLDVPLPSIYINAGETVGVALQFVDAGPRYFGTGTPAYSEFTDGTLTLLTGDVRSAPFTTGGSFFTSRALVGSVTYEAVPEPATMTLLALGALAALRKKRKA